MCIDLQVFRIAKNRGKASEAQLEPNSGITLMFLSLSFKLHPHQLSKKASTLVVLQGKIASLLYKQASIANLPPPLIYSVLSWERLVMQYLENISSILPLLCSVLKLLVMDMWTSYVPQNTVGSQFEMFPFAWSPIMIFIFPWHLPRLSIPPA